MGWPLLLGLRRGGGKLEVDRLAVEALEVDGLLGVGDFTAFFGGVIFIDLLSPGTRVAKIFGEWVRQDDVFSEFQIVGIDLFGRSFAGEGREISIFIDPDTASSAIDLLGFGAFNEEFSAGGAGVFRLGSEAGYGTDTFGNDVFWLGWPSGGFALENVGHEVVPDGSGTSDTGSEVAHGGVVIVADPSGDEEFGSVANGPVVAQIVGSAGFDRDDLTSNDEFGVGPKSCRSGAVVLNNMRNEIGDFFGDNLFAGNGPITAVNGVEVTILWGEGLFWGNVFF